MDDRWMGAGLCTECRHGRLIISGKGSTFLLCERSRSDPSFPRYPSLPVLTCRGFEERSASTSTPVDDPPVRG